MCLISDQVLNFFRSLGSYFCSRIAFAKIYDIYYTTNRIGGKISKKANPIILLKFPSPWLCCCQRHLLLQARMALHGRFFISSFFQPANIQPFSELSNFPPFFFSLLNRHTATPPHRHIYSYRMLEKTQNVKKEIESYN